MKLERKYYSFIKLVLAGTLAGTMLSGCITSHPYETETGIVLDYNNEENDLKKASFGYLIANDGVLDSMAIQQMSSYDQFGLIVRISSSRVSSFQIIDNIQSILEQYEVGGPIYLDITSLPYDMTEEEFYDRVMFICKVLEDNGCYVGIYGTINGLDCFEQISEERNDGQYSQYDIMVFDSNGEVDLDSFRGSSVDNGESVKIIDGRNPFPIIAEKHLNQIDDDFQIEDYPYIVQEGDTLWAISEQFGVSLDELISYNNIEDASIIYPGTVIRIPSMNQDIAIESPSVPEIIEEESINSVEENSPYHTDVSVIIDVSDCNGYIDWDLIAQQYQEGKIAGVILRIADHWTSGKDGNKGSYSFYEDRYFKRNLSECNRLGIPYGFYVFTRFFNEETMNTELYDLENYIDSILLSSDENLVLNPTFPFYIDAFEPDASEQYYLLHSGNVEDVKLGARLMNEFARKLSERGYTIGLYANRGDFLQSGLGEFIDYDVIGMLWLADYGYDVPLSIGEHTLSKSWLLSDGNCYIMYQVSSKGSIEGIEGFIDIDLCSSDFVKKSNAQQSFGIGKR